MWWLAQEARFAGRRAEVVIVSNEAAAVAIFGQKAARREGEPVVWDYHVVLTVDGDRGREVWDLDCTGGAPLALADWLALSFDARLPARFAPRFRPVDAAVFVARFASDRRHMRAPDGAWEAEPPTWPIIGGGAHELERFVDVSDQTFGTMLDLDAFRAAWR